VIFSNPLAEMIARLAGGIDLLAHREPKFNSRFLATRPAHASENVPIRVICALSRRKNNDFSVLPALVVAPDRARWDKCRLSPICRTIERREILERRFLDGTPNV
jgi:hypothetical protein